VHLIGFTIETQYKNITIYQTRSTNPGLPQGNNVHILGST